MRQSHGCACCMGGQRAAHAAPPRLKAAAAGAALPGRAPHPSCRLLNTCGPEPLGARSSVVERDVIDSINILQVTPAAGNPPLAPGRGRGGQRAAQPTAPPHKHNARARRQRGPPPRAPPAPSDHSRKPVTRRRRPPPPLPPPLPPPAPPVPQATMLAMEQAVRGLSQAPDYVLVVRCWLLGLGAAG